MTTKKRTMNIGIHGKNVNIDGMYHVHWGVTGDAYNRNVKKFRTRENATKFKNSLVKKYSPLYTIDYLYIKD
jgi:hypothetical protein